MEYNINIVRVYSILFCLMESQEVHENESIPKR